MVKKLNVALIGGGFMGKAHSLAYAAMPMFFWPAPAIPVRKLELGNIVVRRHVRLTLAEQLDDLRAQLKKCAHALWVELRAGLGGHFRERLDQRQSLAVRTVRDHRIERVGHRHDSR